MIDRIMLAGLLLGILASTAAPGDIQWATDYEAALLEARERNVPLYITVHTNAAQCTPMRRTVLRSGGFSNPVNQHAVALIAHAETGHKSKRTRVFDRSKRKYVMKEVCTLYGGGITCEDHKRVYQQVSAAGLLNGLSQVPASMFLGGSGGKVLISASDCASQCACPCLTAIGTMFKKARAKVGKGMQRATYYKILDRVAAAKKGTEKGKYRSAVRLLGQYARTRSFSQGLRTRMRTELEELDLRGMALVEKARDAADKKALTRLKTEFRGRPVAKAAGKALADLEKQ